MTDSQNNAGPNPQGPAAPPPMGDAPRLPPLPPDTPPHDSNAMEHIETDNSAPPASQTVAETGSGTQTVSAPSVTQNPLPTFQHNPQVIHQPQPTQPPQPLRFGPHGDAEVIGCAADFSHMYPPMSWKCGNNATQLKSYIVFNIKVCNGDMTNLFVPAGYLGFARSLNKDDKCPWGFVEVNSQVPEWVHFKPAPLFKELGVQVPSDWELERAAIVIQKFMDPADNRFKMARVETALRSMGLLDSLNVKLAAANEQIESMRNSHRGQRSGASSTGHSVSGSPYGSCPVSCLSQTHVTTLERATANAAGGSHAQYRSSSPAFMESDHGTPPMPGFEVPLSYESPAQSGHGGTPDLLYAFGRM
ncbi:hypothetical protein DXG01_003992 [Tephrocybe rancida]|nr:hypothetical protein DXG01_003992 [Tephrocybe rancida]